jgi:hypothetical protein
MNKKVLRRGFGAVVVAGLMAASYFAGVARANPDAIAKLDHSVPFLVKARAVLDAISTRQGVGHIQKAKANIDTAIKEIEKAKTANGG